MLIVACDILIKKLKDQLNKEFEITYFNVTKKILEMEMCRVCRLSQ